MDSTEYLASQDRAPQFITVQMIMLVSMVIAVSLRFTSRALAPRSNLHASRFWWDDWLALAAIPFIATPLLLLIPACRLGLGKHITSLEFANIKPLFLIFFSTSYVGALGVTLTKVSALLFYSRLFDTGCAPKWFKIGVYIMHFVNAAIFVFLITLNSILCQPIAKLWNPMLPGHCVAHTLPILSFAIASMVSDLAILVLPMPIVYQLHLSRWQKMGCFCVFIMTYSTVVVCIGRTISVVQTQEEYRLDPTYATIPTLYWFYADGPVTLISICIPSIILLGRRISVIVRSHIQSTKKCESSSSSSKRTVDNITDETESQQHHLKLDSISSTSSIDRFV